MDEAKSHGFQMKASTLVDLFVRNPIAVVIFNLNVWDFIDFNFF